MNISPSKAKRRALGLLRENRRGRPWRTIAREDFQGKVNHATLNRFATSKGAWIPKDEGILIALGLMQPRKPKLPKPVLLPWQKEIRQRIASLAKDTRQSIFVVKHE